MARRGFYAVRSGRSVGVFDTWAECEEAVNGYSGAVFMRFDSHDEASAFVDGSGSASGLVYSGQRTSSRPDHRSSDDGSSDYFYRAPQAQSARVPARRVFTYTYIDGAALGSGMDRYRARYRLYRENQHLNMSQRLVVDPRSDNWVELTEHDYSGVHPETRRPLYGLSGAAALGGIGTELPTGSERIQQRQRGVGMAINGKSAEFQSLLPSKMQR